MRLPIDPRDIMSSGSKLAEERERPVRIAVFVDVEAPDELVDAVREALRPQTVAARCCTSRRAHPARRSSSIDGRRRGHRHRGPGRLRSSARSQAAREKFVPTVVLALDEHADVVSRRLGHPLLDTIADNRARATFTRSSARGSPTASAASGSRWRTNFAFVRRAVAEEAVKATSFQNGVIGARRRSFPAPTCRIMTANQAKMVLQIAAAYGEPLGAERIKELAAVVGGAFTLRAIARQFLDFVPGIGWAIKGGIGYSGTIAMGYAAIEYFEGGSGPVAACASSSRKRATRRSRPRASASAADFPPRDPIPAHGYVVVSAPGAARRPSDRRAPEPLQARRSATTEPLAVTQADLWPRIEPLLGRVERPARYVDREWGARHDADADYRAVLIYPDTYEIGQANQAHRDPVRAS